MRLSGPLDRLSPNKTFKYVVFEDLMARFVEAIAFK